MPRIPRGQVAGRVYHVLNRCIGGAIMFHKDADYVAFLALLQTAKSKFPIHVLGFCLMPNHFHFVLQPATPDALSPFMQWWMTSHGGYHGIGCGDWISPANRIGECAHF